MNHSPADVVRYLLIDLGLGTLPSANGAWPVFFTQEPSKPDDCITVYNTQGTNDGRSMTDGEVMGHFGFQIRIRSSNQLTCYAKATTILETIAQQVLRDRLIVGSTTYFIQCVAKIGDVLDLGKMPDSNRFLCTLNAVVSLRQTI